MLTYDRFLTLLSHLGACLEGYANFAYEVEKAKTDGTPLEEMLDQFIHGTTWFTTRSDYVVDEYLSKVVLKRSPVTTSEFDEVHWFFDAFAYSLTVDCAHPFDDMYQTYTQEVTNKHRYFLDTEDAPFQNWITAQFAAMKDAVLILLEERHTNDALPLS